MKRIFFTIISLICIIVFFSCEKKHQLPQKIAQVVFPIQTSFVPVNNSLQSDSGKNVFVINVANEIQVFEFDTNGIHLSYRFSLKTNLPKRSSLIFIKNTDSIFVFDNDTQILTLTDSLGTSYKEMLLSEAFPIIASSSSKLQCVGKHVFLGNSSDSLEWGIDYMKQIKPIYQVTLLPEQDFSTQTIGFFPEKYQTHDFHDFYPMVCPISENEIVMSYACDDSIYVLKNGEKTSAFLCRSKYIDRFTPFNVEKKSDMVYLKDYMSLEPRYADLIYNPYKNQFYRIALHRKHYDENHQITSANWSLIVMNAAYQITNEYFFDTKKTSNFLIIPAQEGVYTCETTQNSEFSLSLFAL